MSEFVKVANTDELSHGCLPKQNPEIIWRWEYAAH